VAITLGKDCTVSAGGTIASARNVSFTQTARTIDIEEYGSRYASVYSTGHDVSVSIEFNDVSDSAALNTAFLAGTDITVSGGAGAWSFPAVVTGITESDPVDGVATFTVEARVTRQGLKQ
jgi:hypothetical protein